MSRIVFFCIPAYGHTNPTIGVVKELVKRGNEVYYYSFEIFRDMIEDAGANFISCDGYELNMDMDEEKSAKIATDLKLSTEIIVKATLSMDEQIEKDMARIRPDVIVADSVAFWGKLTAMKTGIPFVSSTTTFAFNKESASVMKPSGKEMIKMLWDLPKTKKLLKPLRDKGYPADNIIRIIQNDNDTTTVVYTSPMFQPKSETFSNRYSFVGAIPKEPEGTFEKKREKLVYISLGTVDNRYPDFYDRCIESFAESPFHVVISAGRSSDDLNSRTLPENIEVFSFVSQTAVLEKADVFISHCGMNSASESLWYSVPLVMFPQTSEQRGVANRIEELGAGLMLEDTNRILETAVKVMENETFRLNAEKIGDSLKACPGAAGAADVIERAAEKG